MCFQGFDGEVAKARPIPAPVSDSKGFADSSSGFSKDKKFYSQADSFSRPKAWNKPSFKDYGSSNNITDQIWAQPLPHECWGQESTCFYATFVKPKRHFFLGMCFSVARGLWLPWAWAMHGVARREGEVGELCVQPPGKLTFLISMKPLHFEISPSKNISNVFIISTGT